ncbi:HNH endonuclease [Deltaproteobacteria bacterium TL4]
MKTSNFPDDWYFPMDPEELQKEKQNARALRQSQWWKNKRACNRCYYCQKTVPARMLTMDHVIPLARGGKSSKSNTVPCCKECNTQKKNLLPTEWEEYLQQLANSQE